MTDGPYEVGDSFSVDPGPSPNPLRHRPWHSYVFVALNSRVLALHRENGEERWMWKAGQNWITLFLCDDRLIVSAHGYVTCLDPTNGRPIWVNPLKGKGLGVTEMTAVPAPGPPVADKPPSFAHLIYFGLNKRVLALDRDSGELVWEWDQGGASSALILDDDRLIVGSNGYITCLDPLDGRQLWHNPLKGHGLGITTLVSRHAPASGPSPRFSAAQMS